MERQIVIRQVGLRNRCFEKLGFIGKLTHPGAVIFVKVDKLKELYISTLSLYNSIQDMWGNGV